MKNNYLPVKTSQ